MKYVHITIAMLLIISILGSPVISLAQQNEVEVQAISDAKRDVENDINKPMWFAMGLFLGTGLVLSYTSTPTVPAGKILGKDPTYVAFYTDTYVVELKKAQTQYALGGCITLGVGCCILQVASGFVTVLSAAIGN